MDVDAYLQRIGYDGPCTPDVDTLKQLHRAHMFSVPFENLDICLGRSVVLSLPSLFDKIVIHRRGGFCYELNTLFSWLLQEIGFNVEILSGRVYDNNVPGPEFDHMLLIVNADEKYIADVGFGDSFVEPIPLGHEEQHQFYKAYKLFEKKGKWTLTQFSSGSNWYARYAFSLRSRIVTEFHDMCHYHETSPDSMFTRNLICSLATTNGRISLSNDRFIVTSRGSQQDKKIPYNNRYIEILNKNFSINLSEEAEMILLRWLKASTNHKI